MPHVDDSRIASFREGFGGDVLTEGDAGYGDARHIWNGDIDRRPAVIARCRSTEDVAAAIRFGVETGLEISVRGGGHGFNGSAVAEDGLMIDLGAMNQVHVDPAARVVACGGGATWAAVDAAAQAHGLATVGGTVSDTGVGGLTLGGGMGWLTPKLGLAIDNLVACEVVTADGAVIRASDGEHPDLFWALRGGGGNFGVVTRFELRLHQVGPIVNLGMFFWAAEDVGRALRFCREFLPTLPDDMGAMLVGMTTPPAPFVPPEHQGRTCFVLAVVGFGTAEEHERATRPVLERGATLFHMMTPIPYVELQKMLDPTAPWGSRAYDRGLYADGLSDGMIDAIAEHLPRKSSPMSLTIMFWARGAFRRVPDDATAFGGSRDTRIVMTMAGICAEPGPFPAEREWVRAFWEAVMPYARGDGSYVNFMSDYDEDRVRATYGPAKYERLARIKAEYDPRNVFHLNANVKPALQPA